MVNYCVIRELPAYKEIIRQGCEEITTETQKKHGTVAFLTPKGKFTVFTNGYIRRGSVTVLHSDNKKLIPNESPVVKGKTGAEVLKTTSDWNTAFRRVVQRLSYDGVSASERLPLSEWRDLFERAKLTKNADQKQRRIARGQTKSYSKTL